MLVTVILLTLKLNSILSSDSPTPTVTPPSIVPIIHRHFRHGRNPRSLQMENLVHIKAKRNTFIVLDEKAYLIPSFSIVQNGSDDCYSKYLTIEYPVQSKDGKTDFNDGFLDELTGEIHLTQVTTTSCKKIKRFVVDKESVVISLFKLSAHIKNEEIDEFIQWELLKKYQVWTWFMYTFQIYDENHDRLSYFMALKNLIFYGVSFYYFLMMICEIYCVMISLTDIVREHKKKTGITNPIKKKK